MLCISAAISLLHFCPDRNGLFLDDSVPIPSTRRLAARLTEYEIYVNHVTGITLTRSQPS